jgi:DNA repair exonuclease SbcCD ATPase subunit
MRPLKLRLSNFASFRGDGVELDFTPLELFAIAGPTGAGKSSLLDAMIFALYGRVPRIGGRGAAEMISLGAARMSVGLDFRVGGDAYRVTRVARRRGAGTAQLEQLGADGEARPLKASVREVDEEILRLVGLSLDAFTQAVVLPQGEFQKFLKSAPRDRREILSRILRLQIYERTRELAARRRDHFSQSVQQAERRLTEDYADATAQNLAALSVRATDLGAKIEALSSRLEEAVTRRNALQIARAKTRELEQTFQALVAGASDRLWELTKRYRFQWQDEAFQVVDHDNARQIRSADTLSGGETFLASLALALQLSAQVQSAADARILDSLFIDEGFGTLDPGALDAAASAIESLPVGGRMVGIITHIDELSQRLPARVKVGKTADGSRLTVEAG